jgi:protein-L-isoaspartate(D-aspartate) O-methyltransferase
LVASSVEPEFRGARRRLIETLQDKGIKDLAVLRAIDQVPRHLFVPPTVRHRAYEDSALPIGNGQTISQPFVHARTCELLMLTGREKVLEIGTGSAYQTALLANLSAQVFSVERYAALLDRARLVLAQAQVRNVSVLLGDGTLGWREYGPYDAIVVSAGAPHIPPALEAQLAEGGRLLIPIGDRDEQMLSLFTRHGQQLEQRDIGPARFVPLIGAGGWPS